MKLFYYRLLIFFFCISISGCKRNKTEIPPSVSPETTIVKTLPNHEDMLVNAIKSPSREITGDTIWAFRYGNQSWYDTLTRKNITVHISAWVDTTDYIVDTVRAARTNRIVIGFNQYYSLEFINNEKPWFYLNFNKKNDLRSILYGTDLWVESNLNMVNDIFFNEKFENIVVELSINSGDEFNNMFYLVSNTEGKIVHLGTISSWGGGGPDGSPFLTDDCKMYITCNEVYNFVSGTAINLSEYVAISQMITGKYNTSEYEQIHGLRYLSNNNFLVVFNRYHNKPRYNALILNTDSLIVGRFGYYGMVEDIDAVLLYERIKRLKKVFLYDSERETLISITQDSIPVIRETPLYEMVELKKDTNLMTDYSPLSFGFYGSYEFYISNSDSTIYYSSGKSN